MVDVSIGELADRARTVAELAGVLRQLRRRHARHTAEPPLTYRRLAGHTGWSHGVIGDYLSGVSLAPTHRFDVLVRLLGATPAEQGALATARDRVEEGRLAGAGESAPPVPRQLPGAVPDFVGRTEEMAALDRAVTASAKQAVVPIVALAGPAGAGKTALAVQWAHRTARRFPGGQLYAVLGDADPAAVTRQFLVALGVSADRLPTGTAGLIGRYRSLLAHRRTLIVLDDATRADQIRPLVPGTAGSAVVVTGRTPLIGLVAAEGAVAVAVAGLPPAEGRRLLAARLGNRAVGADPAVVDELVASCSGLPGPLTVLASRELARPRLPLAALAAKVHGAR
ncbi:hypothetical protein Asp14428_66700 [Actinoplanes sp. NBRC 14428]|nr:hypothetical protein Asp14428_66700 [Actinoplanes sp. NBRC 14428]